MSKAQTNSVYRELIVNWRRQDKQEGTIYFVGPIDLNVGRVKIGFTNGSIESRLAALQTGSPFELTPYLTIQGRKIWEDLMHRYFVEYRLHGEWFAVDGDLAAFVKACLTKRDELGRDLDSTEVASAFLSATIHQTSQPDRTIDRKALLVAMSTAQR